MPDVADSTSAEPEVAAEPSGEPALPRSPRAERSRAAIADAALALLREGDPRPTAARIAERAGISERLVFHHFGDLEELFDAAAEQQVRAVRARVVAVPTTGPLEARIRAMVVARADMNEWITPVRRASVVREPFSPSLAARRAALNAGSRAQIAGVFAIELSTRPAADADDLVAALDLALSWPGWEALRTRGASIEQATRVVDRTVRALLAS